MKNRITLSLILLAGIAFSQAPVTVGRWNIAASNGTYPNAVNANFYNVEVINSSTTASTAQSDAIYGRANFTTGVICVYPSKTLRNAGDTTTATACATGINPSLANQKIVLGPRHGTTSVSVNYIKKFIISGTYYWDVVASNVSRSIVDSVATSANGCPNCTFNSVTANNGHFDSLFAENFVVADTSSFYEKVTVDTLVVNTKSTLNRSTVFDIGAGGVTDSVIIIDSRNANRMTILRSGGVQVVADTFATGIAFGRDTSAAGYHGQGYWVVASNSAGNLRKFYVNGNGYDRIVIDTGYNAAIKLLAHRTHIRNGFDAGTGFTFTGTIDAPIMNTTVSDGSTRAKMALENINALGGDELSFFTYITGNVIKGLTVKNESIIVPQDVTVGNNLAVTGAAIFGGDSALKQTSGSFATQMADCASGGSGTIKWVRTRNVVTLDIPNISCVSNGASTILSGLPAALRPLREQAFPVFAVQDNSLYYTGTVDVPTNGNIFLYKNTVGLVNGDITFTSTFTGANNKGMVKTSITYILN